MAKKKVSSYTVRIHSSVPISPMDWKNVFNDRIGIAKDGGTLVELDGVEAHSADAAGEEAKRTVVDRYPKTDGHLTVEKVWQPPSSQKYVEEKFPKV